jgi:hypothetical protein
MHCVSGLSFRLYWTRLIFLQSALFLAIVRQVITFTGHFPASAERCFPVEKDTQMRKWQRLCIAGRKLAAAYSRLPNTVPLDGPQTICLAVTAFYHFPMRSGP